LLHPEDPTGESLAEAELPGQICVKELTVDVRWRMDKLRSFVAQALGEPEGSRLWLWDAGAPSVVSAAPRFTEDVQSLGAATLQNLGYARMTSANRKLALHAVLLPVPPPKTRPVLVRFFNDKVWEVGAHIFHVPDQEDEVDRRLQRRTGVPNIVPESLIVMARAHLEKPENVSLRKAFCWCLEDDPDPVTIPPLRLLEVRNSRIERVFRERRPADLEDGSELWQAKSDDQNFIHNAFRVEADLNVRPSKVPSQLIEVIHTDPNHIIGCFGHPFFLEIAEGSSGRQICVDIEEKLLWHRRVIPAFFGMQPRCRLLMAKGELRSNDRVRLWQEVRDDYRWEWQVPSGLYLMAPDEKRPITGAPSEWHPDFMFLGIERNHPLYQCRTSILPQRAGNKPLTIKAA